MFGYDKLPGRGGFLALIASAALVTLSAQAMAAPTLSFDDDSSAQDGVVTHVAGGTAVGSNIDFVSLVGIDTPLQDGTVLSCIDCFLNFETGDLLTQGPSIWEWAGPGTFELSGTLQDGGGSTIATGVLVSGTFDSAVAAGSGNSLSFTGFGTDTKAQGILDFYGITSNDFDFLNTELALNSTLIQPDGSFTANVGNADLDNTANIPIPGTLGLLGFGLVAFGAAMRRNRSV